MRQLLIVVSAVLLAAPAAAQPVDVAAVVEATSNEDLKAGFKAYDGLEFEAGLKSFKAALEAKLTPGERAAAALYGGLIAQSLSDEAGARVLFEEAITARPEIELPGDAPPKTQLTFAEVKRAWKAKAPPADDHLEAAAVKPDPEAAPGEEAAVAQKPIYEQWWLWTIVGAVVVGGIATGVAVGASGGPAPCGGNGAGCIDITVPSSGVWRNR